MRNTRNPRYAPEFLERKLSPSAMIGGLAAVAMVSSPSPNPTPAIDLPPLPPPPPRGPVGPA